MSNRRNRIRKVLVRIVDRHIKFLREVKDSIK